MFRFVFVCLDRSIESKAFNERSKASFNDEEPTHSASAPLISSHLSSAHRRRKNGARFACFSFVPFVVVRCCCCFCLGGREGFEALRRARSEGPPAHLGRGFRPGGMSVCSHVCTHIAVSSVDFVAMDAYREYWWLWSMVVGRRWVVCLSVTDIEPIYRRSSKSNAGCGRGRREVDHALVP